MHECVPHSFGLLLVGWIESRIVMYFRMLVRNGYAVAAIDGCFNGGRVGKGPRGERDKADAQELNLFKLHLWQGRTLWGMMLHDEQCLLDYLATRSEVDMTRVGATDMSMSCTRAWWLAAIDERIHAIVGVACFTHYTELLAHRSSHGIYNFVSGLLKHFDSEAIYSLGRDGISRSGGDDPDDINTWNQNRPWDKSPVPLDVTIGITLLASSFLLCVIYVLARRRRFPPG